MSFLLIFESSMKSSISYRFSQKYREPHAYLIIKNYTRDPHKLKDVLGVISKISYTISDKGKKNTPVRHYIDKHEGVPLWVLVNYLTLGNVNFFYKCLRDTLKNIIAKDFADNYKRDYSQRIHLTSDMMESILKTTNYYRNVCAHEERLYSYRIYKPSPSSDISTALNIPNNKLNKGNVFTLVSFLKLVIPKKEHKALIIQINRHFNKYESKFNSVKFTEILKVMGFPRNWENYL